MQKYKNMVLTTFKDYPTFKSSLADDPEFEFEECNGCAINNDNKFLAKYFAALELTMHILYIILKLRASSFRL